MAAWKIYRLPIDQTVVALRHPLLLLC